MLRGLILGASTLVLVACGGGGGGGGGGGLPGGPNGVNAIKVEVRADASTLPLNITGEGPRIGGVYTTTLYVTARAADGSMLSGEDLFSFNFVRGFESAQLYYLDGDEDHEVEVEDPNDPSKTIKVPAAFRFGTLDAAGNGATMHLHSRDKVGTAEIEYSVVSNGVKYKGTVVVQIGAVSTGRPSQVVLKHQAPNELFVQGVNEPTQLVVQANVVDEAGQAVPNPTTGTNNLLASIVTGTTQCAAGVSAELRSGASSGKSVMTSSINGQAQFTIVSGTAAGLICVEFYSDRTDNNVSNGITQLVYNATGVPATVFGTPSSPLAITSATLPEAYLGTPYAQFLAASGGHTPYTWTLRSGSTLPAGLSLSTDGVISGSPIVSGDKFQFIVQVTDASGAVKEKSFELKVNATGGAGPAVVTTALPGGKIGVPYSAVMLASGGKAPYTWTVVPAAPAPGLTMSVGGVLSGTPTAVGTFSAAFTVTDANGLSVTVLLSITVAA